MVYHNQLGALITSLEIVSLFHFSFFTLEVYIVLWFEVRISSYAPISDLDLTKDILRYHDKEIRKACFIVLGHHF